jgi:hypothetical protein
MSYLALLFAALVSPPAEAPPADVQPIIIRSGESLAIEFRDNKPVVVDRSPAAPMTAFETGMLRQVQAQEVPAGAGPQPAISMPKGTISAEPPKVAPDRIQLTFRRVPALRAGDADHSFLTLLNGYGNSFRYRAAMHANGRITATDVCEILSQVPASEHWPYVIDQLDLTAAWLEPSEQGRVRCE